MLVEITDNERELLAELLEAAEKEMIVGIDHADAREYRRWLQGKLAVLEHLRSKIGSERTYTP